MHVALLMVTEAPRLVWLLNVGFDWCRMSTPFHKLIALLSGCPSGLGADTVPITASHLQMTVSEVCKQSLQDELR